MRLGELRRALDLGDVEVMHDHMVAGAEFAVMGEHVIEFVPVERADHGIGIRRSCGLDRVQPLQCCGIIGGLGSGGSNPVVSAGEPVGPGRR